MNPYNPSLVNVAVTSKKLWPLKTGIVVGCLLTVAPLFGLLGTIFEVRRAFDSLGSSGIGDPTKLSTSVGTSLVSTAVGLGLCPIGLLILILSLVFHARRKKEIQAAAFPGKGA